MIATLRAFFLSRALREKLLLLAFVVLGVAWWASSFSTRAGGFWSEQRSLAARLREQSMWINNQAQIEASAEKMAGLFDPARTLNSNQLVAAVGQLANDAGLQYASGTPVNRPAGQFTVHEVEFRFSNVEWGALTKFYQALQERAPYIAVERFTLQSNANPAQLTLLLKVVSVEIAR